MENLIQELENRFFHNRLNYATAQIGANRLAYYPTKQEITADVIEKHLKGEIAIAVFPIFENTVKWMAFDIDSNNSVISAFDAQRLSDFLSSISIPHMVEFSGRKGYHLWILLEDKISSSVAFTWLQQVLLNFKHSARIEIFPKQPSIRISAMGNHLKLPLGLHPVTKNRSVFGKFDSTGEFIPEENFEWKICLIEDLHKQLPLSSSEQLAAILSQYWTEGSRHSMALALAGFLAKTGWSQVQTINLITEICKKSGDIELENRLTCVRDTYKRFARGEPTLGYSQLVDLLPVAKLKEILALVFDTLPQEQIRLIDRIRLDRKPSFLKVRDITKILHTHLLDNGKIFYDSSRDQLFWFSPQHSVIPLESPEFFYYLYREFGISVAEDFGRKVFKDVTLLCSKEAESKRVHLISHWDSIKKVLYVNPEGNKVFALNGETILQQDNGEEVFFQTRMHLDLDWSDWREIDAWSVLSDDLTFQSSELASASPEEQVQLLRLWILSIFFPELMRTKPLLLVLGDPGSGKTTAVRRIIKLIESPDLDVLEFVWDKPDALRASITHHRVLCLDNMENTRSNWLLNILDAISTGSSIELRKLYFTNDMIRLKPDCYVAITAISSPFSEESFFDRVLPIDLRRIKNPLPEWEIQEYLQNNWKYLWCDMLQKLNKVVREIQTHSSKEIIRLRMADFASLASRVKTISPSILDYAVLQSGLNNLSNRQVQKMAEESPFVTILLEWLERYPKESREFKTLRELSDELIPIAKFRGLKWKWSSTVSLANHLRAIELELDKLIGVEIKMDRVNGKKIEKYRFGYKLYGKTGGEEN